MEPEGEAPPPPKPHLLTRILLTIVDVRELQYFPRGSDGKVVTTDRQAPIVDGSLVYVETEVGGPEVGVEDERYSGDHTYWFEHVFFPCRKGSASIGNGTVLKIRSDYVHDDPTAFFLIHQEYMSNPGKMSKATIGRGEVRTADIVESLLAREAGDTKPVHIVVPLVQEPGTLPEGATPQTMGQLHIRVQTLDVIHPEKVVGIFNAMRSNASNMKLAGDRIRATYLKQFTAKKRVNPARGEKGWGSRRLVLSVLEVKGLKDGARDGPDGLGACRVPLQLMTAADLFPLPDGQHVRPIIVPGNGMVAEVSGGSDEDGEQLGFPYNAVSHACSRLNCHEVIRISEAELLADADSPLSSVFVAIQLRGREKGDGARPDTAGSAGGAGAGAGMEGTARAGADAYGEEEYDEEEWREYEDLPLAAARVPLSLLLTAMEHDQDVWLPMEFGPIAFKWTETSWIEWDLSRPPAERAVQHENLGTSEEWPGPRHPAGHVRVKLYDASKAPKDLLDTQGRIVYGRSVMPNSMSALQAAGWKPRPPAIRKPEAELSAMFTTLHHGEVRNKSANTKPLPALYDHALKGPTRMPAFSGLVSLALVARSIAPPAGPHSPPRRAGRAPGAAAAVASTTTAAAATKK